MNPFNFFDKIVCINLDRRPDRWKICQNIFTDLNIINQAFRFSAIDYKDTNIPDKDKGKFGCTHSHIQLIKYAKQSGLDNILIFEDDLHPHINSQQIENHLSNCISELPNDWEIFYLSANPLEHPDSLSEFGDHICTVKLAFTTHALAVNHTAYDKILNGAKTDKDVLNMIPDIVNKHINIDGYYMSCILPNSKSFMPKKLLFTQRNSFSDIDFCSRDIDGIIIDRYKKFNNILQA